MRHIERYFGVVDELMNESGPGGWELAGAGRSGWRAMRSKEVGGYESAWKRAWLFSWKGGVVFTRLARFSGKKTFSFYCTRWHNGLGDSSDSPSESGFQTFELTLKAFL